MKTCLTKTYLCLGLFALLVSCQTKEDLIIQPETEETELSLETKAFAPESFDWETVDYMPTPPTQAILVPWAPGNGGLDAFYGNDVLYDHLKRDGWKLIYSTFKSSGAPLIDPFFVLYNIYRGTLRIYIYLNSITTSASSYIEDALSLNGTVSSSILNYLGADMVDVRNNVKTYNSVRPKPLNGGAPLMNNQWYMVEYEMAYDPSLKNKSAQSLRFQLKTDSYNISNIQLGGNATSEITGTIGATSSTPLDLIKGQVPEAIKGVAGIVGESLLNHQKRTPTEDNAHNNKLGIKNSYFTAILSGVSKVASSFLGGLPSFAGDLLSAVISGTSGSAGTAVSLKAETTIKLEGTSTNVSAINSISMYVPGMSFSGNIQGMIPLNNIPLGVIGFVGSNRLYIRQERSFREVVVNRGGDDEYYTECEMHREIRYDPNGWNYKNCLVFNPELLKIADVTILSEDLIERNTKTGKIDMNIVEADGFISNVPGPGQGSYNPLPDYDYGVRFLIKVQPKDGSPVSYIFKTFKLDVLWGGAGYF